jgi:hypothetical protein
MCTEGCSMTTGGCPANGICADQGMGDLGACIQTCTSNDDCRTAEGYSCGDLGLGQNVCWLF